MPAALPSVAVIVELETRQEEALRKLAELEQQVDRALTDFTAISKRAAEIRVSGEPSPATIKFPAAPTVSVPAAKVA